MPNGKLISEQTNELKYCIGLENNELALNDYVTNKLEYNYNNSNG